MPQVALGNDEAVLTMQQLQASLQASHHREKFA
jgi:hypothetical protein